MTINDRVKEVRKNLSLSQEEFGNKIGLSKSGISNIENGTRNPSVNLLKRLADGMECTSQQILDTNFKKLFSYIVRLHKPYDTLDIAPRNPGQLSPTV